MPDQALHAGLVGPKSGASLWGAHQIIYRGVFYFIVIGKKKEIGKVRNWKETKTYTNCVLISYTNIYFTSRGQVIVGLLFCITYQASEPTKGNKGCYLNSIRKS